jgi:hypothetical protein
MLAHDLASALAADRERAIRHAARLRGLPPRPSSMTRLRAWVFSLLRPRPARRPARSSSRLATGLGDVVGGVSARTGGTNGQGAC